MSDRHPRARKAPRQRNQALTVQKFFRLGLRSSGVAALLVLAVISCGPGDSGSQILDNLFSRLSDFTFPSQAKAVQIPPAGSLVMETLQPEALSMLEVRGFRLSDQLAKARFGRVPAQPYKSVQELSHKNSWYLDLVQHISSELDQHAKTDDFNLRADDDRNRLFDKRWFTSPDAQFELVGLVNRIDQREFSPGRDCGELRLIYRLNYDKTGRGGGFSRLPVTFNFVFSVPHELNSVGKSCVLSALRWKVPAGLSRGEDFVQWLVDGPLRGGTLAFKQLEINLQASRIVSSNKPDLGGSATYFLFVFAPDPSGRFVPQKLRNTIDQKRIGSDSGLRAELKSFLLSNLGKIDAGVYEIPEKFLATKSVSFTTHGLNRLGNMPFGTLFSTSEFSGADYSQLSLLNSPQALLRRLDDGSCSGCHQSDSVAGFHLLGFEHPDRLHPLNAVRVGYSAHFRSEMERRRRAISRLASGLIDPPVRPFSFVTDSSLPVRAGHRCVTADRARFLKPGAAPQCGSGGELRCEVLEDNDQLTFDLGTCVRSKPVAGDPCVKGALTTNIDNPNRDKIRNSTFACTGSSSASSYVCLQPEQGVPGGLCYRRCTSALGAFDPSRELCAYNGGADFDGCAASGDFSRCLLSGTSRGLRQACDESTPCREDYICQSFFGVDADRKRIGVPSDKRGFCVPTYFIFQLRLDGHPVP